MIYYKDDICIFFGSLNPLPHDHHAVEICIGTDQLLHIRVNGEAPVDYKAGLILANCVHEAILDPGKGEKITLLLDADLPVARAITHAYKDSTQYVIPLNPDTVNPFIRQLKDLKVIGGDNCGDLMLVVIREMLPVLFPPSLFPEAPALDERISTVVSYIREHIENKNFSLAGIAKMVDLSEGRLAHLFKDEIGIPFRKYVLWTRLKVAVNHVLKGTSITQASYIAGFSDSSHFNKVYVKMFGLNPSGPLWA
ncbi:MAG TPA: AraC family transcriptional regulator [Bacteroidia bacterium]|jgi:AraC-like DNA-binding protein|nr:AraC family transcriptional regulator [Bacteroidia bacterium]